MAEVSERLDEEELQAIKALAESRVPPVVNPEHEAWIAQVSKDRADLIEEVERLQAVADNADAALASWDSYGKVPDFRMERLRDALAGRGT